MLLGGAFGDLDTGANSDGCYSAAGGISLAKSGTGSTLFGGFAGYIDQNTSVINCYSRNPVNANNGPTADSELIVGGFAGYIIGSTLKNCYATGDVSTTGNSWQYTGGLLGWTGFGISIIGCYATGKVNAVNNYDGSSKDFTTGGLIGNGVGAAITQCWAGGDVIAQKGSTGDVPVIIGGLVGYLGYPGSSPSQAASITDCYALGNVIADNPNSSNAAEVYAGGLVGYAQIAAGTPTGSGVISKSFATGNVTARNASGSAGAWAGGIAGYVDSGTLENCVAAALNQNGQEVKITAKGGSNRYASRVYGGMTTPSGTPLNPSVSNNYANSMLYTGTDASYNVYAPAVAVVGGTPLADSAEGAHATNTNLRSSTWWTGTAGFGATWNLGSVGYKWPLLVGVGGQ
jgi:hypothetical protein